jgi:hypothetical protein
MNLSAGSASLIQNPWKQSQPRAARKSNCSRVDTPSATTRNPKPRASAMIASVIAASPGSVSMSAMNELSI